MSALVVEDCWTSWIRQKLSTARLSKSIAIAVALLFVHGCKRNVASVSDRMNPQIVWTSEVKSPDARLVATSKAYANGGIGGGVPATFVYVNFTSGSQNATEILNFTNDSDTPDGVSVDMKWLSPTQLEVTYDKRKQDIQFQAVKWGEVTIIARDLPSR